MNAALHASSQDAAWYVVQCRAKQQQRAEQHLIQQGYQCFLPMIEIERVIRGRRQLVSEPLFANYLFIRLNQTNDNWAPIRSTRGVLQIVRFGAHPLAVPDQVIAEIEQRVANMPKLSDLKAGDPVRVCIGSGSGMDAIFLAFDGEERMMILIKLMHQPQRISVPLTEVAIGKH